MSSEWGKTFGKGQRIGNYIYLHAKNYNKYGLKHPDRQIEKRDAGQIFAEMHNQLKQNISNSKVKDQAIERIERLYNFAFGADPLSKTDSGQQVIQAMQQDLVSLIKDKTINIDWDKAQATSYQKGFKGTFGETWTSVEKLEDIYYKILKIRELLIKKDSSAAKGYLKSAEMLGIDLDNKMKELDSLVQSITKKENTAENAGELFKFFKESGTNLQKYTRLYFNENIKPIIEVIRELAIFTTTTSATKAMGILGEDSIVAIDKQIRALGDKEVKKLVEGMTINKGGSAKKAPHIIKDENIIGGNTRENLKDGYIKKLGNTELKLNSVEQKVDIEFIIDGQEVETSIKNYSPHTVEEYGIGILSGSNLLTYLQNNISFANHYLNISSTHEDGDLINQNLLAEAHELLKLQIGVVALVGGLPYLDKDNQIKEEKKADLFIINRQKGGRANFEIYRTSDLISRMINNTNLIDFKGYNTIWRNNRVGTEDSISSAYQRCLDVLMQLRNFKINVKLKDDILD